MTDVIATRVFGGNGGNAFDDWYAAPTHAIRALIGLTVHARQFVEGIIPTYRLANGASYPPVHGGSDGTRTQIDFAYDEQIVAVSGRSGTLLDQLSIYTRIGGGPDSSGRDMARSAAAAACHSSCSESPCTSSGAAAARSTHSA